ncbi:MAG: oligosaccharide flippase family protein, partial [Verrucomicrobiales bacterium]|nr:oligosaccharide flippase family protein [Verrucomicrobiales bacterium]
MPHSESRSKRRRSVRHAVGASLLSKGSSSVLQFVSLPIAARVLGKEEFGIYATISVSLYLLNLLQIGVGPAL